MRATKPILAITAFSAQLLVQHAARAEDGAAPQPAQGAPSSSEPTTDLWQAARSLVATLSHLVAEGAGPVPTVLRATFHAPEVALPAAPPEERSVPSGNGKRACYDDAC